MFKKLIIGFVIILNASCIYSQTIALVDDQLIRKNISEFSLVDNNVSKQEIIRIIIDKNQIIEFILDTNKQCNVNIVNYIKETEEDYSIKKLVWETSQIDISDCTTLKEIIVALKKDEYSLDIYSLNKYTEVYIWYAKLNGMPEELKEYLKSIIKVDELYTNFKNGLPPGYYTDGRQIYTILPR